MSLAAASGRLSTGSPDLDVLLEGGFAPGEVYLVQSDVPELARRVVAWMWARQVCAMHRVCGIVQTERASSFGRDLAVASRDALGPLDGRAFRDLVAGHPVAQVGLNWSAAPNDLQRADGSDIMELVVVDGVPTYRTGLSYEQAREISLNGLTAIARARDVPVLACDQDPPTESDHIRAHSLVAIAGNGRVSIRRRDRTGAGVPMPLPHNVVQKLAPRRKPDFLTAAELVPEVLRHPA